MKRDRWCELIELADELRRPQARTGINPFNGESQVFEPPADAAEIWIAGECLGSAYWSLSGDDDETLIVSMQGDSDTRLKSLVTKWSNELDVKLCIVSSDCS